MKIPVLIAVLFVTASMAVTVQAGEAFQCEATQGPRVLKTGQVDLETSGIFDLELENGTVALTILNTAADTYTVGIFANLKNEKHIFSSEGHRPQFKTGFFVMAYPEFPISFECNRLSTFSRAMLNAAATRAIR